MYLDIHVGHDLNPDIPVYSDTIHTQRCINVHVTVRVRYKILPFVYTQSLTTVVSIDKKDEIRAYMNARS